MLRCFLFVVALCVAGSAKGQIVGDGVFVGDGPCPFPQGCGGGVDGGSSPGSGGSYPGGSGGWEPGVNCSCGASRSEGQQGDDTSSASEGVSNLPPCPADVCGDDKHCCNCCCSKCQEDREREEERAYDKRCQKDTDGDGCKDCDDPYPNDPSKGCGYNPDLAPTSVRSPFGEGLDLQLEPACCYFPITTPWGTQNISSCVWETNAITQPHEAKFLAGIMIMRLIVLWSLGWRLVWKALAVVRGVE